MSETPIYDQVKARMTRRNVRYLMAKAAIDTWYDGELRRLHYGDTTLMTWTPAGDGKRVRPETDSEYVIDLRVPEPRAVQA